MSEEERPQGDDPTMLCRNCGASGAELEGACLDSDDGFHDAHRARDVPPVRAPNRTPAEMVRDAVRTAAAKVAAIYHPRAELGEHQKDAIRRHLEREVDAVLARFPSPSSQFELPLRDEPYPVTLRGMETETTQGGIIMTEVEARRYRRDLRGILKAARRQLDRTITVEDREYRLTCTRSACPEQYDVSLGSEDVAYLRLLHRGFTAQMPDADGEVVHRATSAKGDEFSDEVERTDFLRAAIVAVDAYLQENPLQERAE